MNTVLNITHSLYISDDIDATIIECINNILDGKEYPLLESIELVPILSLYEPLIEAANEVAKAKKDIENVKDEKDLEKKAKLFDKMIESVKKAFNWWYKIDPDKKYKTLHTILKLLVAVIGIIFVFYAPGKAALVKNIAARLPIGYDGANKVLKFFFSKSVIATGIVRAIYGKIYKVISSLDKKCEITANIKDIDKSIEEYDKTIDMLNKMIEETGDPQIKMNLEKTKSEVEKALAHLIKLKERIEKDKENDEK